MKISVFQFSMFGINTYIVSDESTGECAIIDPGMSTKPEEEAITEYMEKNNLHLSHIINTHLHIDHVVGVPYLKEKFNVNLSAHKGDEILGKHIADQARMFGIMKNFENIEITEYLEDGDKIKIGDEELEVITVPGHSKGSVALYDKKDGVLFSGDALFKGSIGRTDLPGGDYTELIENIKSRLMTLPDNTVVLSGHGPATTIGDEKRTNPFLR